MLPDAAIGAPVEAPLRLVLDGAALAGNWRRMAALAGGAACGAAVKADGYGLGAREVVARLAAAGCRDFFVATWAEAEALGRACDGAALSVLHGVRAEDMRMALGHRARPVLVSAAQVARWRAAGGGACDVMIDTGMNRLGLSPAEAASGLLDGLAIETLMSHLACADAPAQAMNERQRADFADLAAAIPARRYSLANSAGVLLGGAYAFDLVRPGLALYGGNPAPGGEAVTRPVATIEAQVLQARDLPAGASVGYGATWRASRPSRIAIVNLGYADGVPNILAARIAFLSDRGVAPIVGRISMDLIALDVTGGDVDEGDWLRLPLEPARLSAATGLSQYELLTGLKNRFARCWR